MNVQTKLSAKGQIVIPKDVRDRLRWTPGTRLEIVEKGTGVTLQPTQWRNPFPLTTTADLDAIPRWAGRARTIEEISELSDDDILFVLREKERDARD